VTDQDCSDSFQKVIEPEFSCGAIGNVDCERIRDVNSESRHWKGKHSCPCNGPLMKRKWPSPSVLAVAERRD